jgi:glycosyltransferase involved in cell wall biosynthesis
MLVSVGIPIYNAGQYLKLAIDSVLQQSYENFELLLVNDGSTDNSLEIIRSYTDPRIKVVNDGSNKGLIFRLNEMVQLSKGQYFARMDADDLMLPNRLEKQVQLITTHPEIDVLFSDAVSIDKDNNILGYKKSQKIKDKKEILKGITPIHPTILAKRDVLVKNPYNDGFVQMEDMELWYRIIEQYHFHNINEPLLFYRENSSQNSLKHLKMVKGKVKFAKQYLPFRNRISETLKTYIKYMVYAMLEILKKEDVLLNKRFMPLAEELKISYKRQLDFIINGGI